MQLAKYQKTSGLAERPKYFVMLWMLFGEPLVRSSIPGTKFRMLLLRLFGAKIGGDVVIKPRVQIKYPWKLSIGDNSWIGERVWIDNLAEVSIGHDVCVSQGAYLCTGSHDWSRPTFDLVIKPIILEAHSWVCAKAIIGPGSVLGQGAVVGLGCVFSGRLKPWHIMPADGAKPINLKKRKIV